MKSWVKILGIRIGKAEGILASQREEQRRWVGKRKRNERKKIAEEIGKEREKKENIPPEYKKGE